MASMEVKTHYDVLEISQSASLLDVKKAYRRLALKHHPDRNNGTAESTEKFKEISEAYSILSDASKRRDYDLLLRSPPSTHVSVPSSSAYSSPVGRRTTDAFRQFDDLFRNDPFFHSAFQDMDDAFAERFDNTKGDQRRDDDTPSTVENTAEDDTGCNGVGSRFFCGAVPQTNITQSSKPKESWGQWIMNKLGIELSVTSYSHQRDGSVVTSAYKSKPSGTYTNKKSRTYRENDGRQVTIMSMEKDGNIIEDKLIAGRLVERKVNGIVEEIPHQVAN